VTPNPRNHLIFAFFVGCHGTSLDKWKYATDPSSARNALSFGVKIVKIGPVDPEILDPISPFCGHVIPDVIKWALSTLELLDQITRNFHTIYRHHIHCYRAYPDHDIAIRFLALVHPMHVVSVDVDTFSQHYLVTMATSLDKLGKKLQIHHPHITFFHMV